MSFLFGSTTIPGNRLTDLVGQTSTVGTGIPFGYGLVKVSEPNVIWTAGIPKEHVKKKKQGKGGVKTTEYTYTLSYAIAFMAGPAFGFLTIKRAGKVVYTTDPNASVDDKAFAAKWLQRAKLYLGTEEQMPDATIESYKGAGKVSAFRGLVYIVVKDDDVTNEGGAVPQYEAVIQATPPDIFVTSLPYPVLTQDSYSFNVTPTGGLLKTLLHERFDVEAYEMEVVPLTGELRDVYVKRMIDEAYSFNVKPVSGMLKTVQVYGKSGPSSYSFDVVPTGGSLAVKLISARSQKNTIQTTVTPTGGVLQ